MFQFAYAAKCGAVVRNAAGLVASRSLTQSFLRLLTVLTGVLITAVVAAFAPGAWAGGGGGLTAADNNTHIDRGVYYTNSSFLTGSGGTAPYTFTITSGLPAGVTVNASGQVSGVTCGSNGNFGLTGTVKDSTNATAAITPTLIVNAAPAGGCSLTFGTAPTSTATVGQAYSSSVAASGGSSGYTYSINSGSLPTGLSLNSSSGVISGTPTAAGASTFAVAAVSGSNTGVSSTYTITVSASSGVSITTTTLASPISMRPSRCTNAT